VVDVELLCSGLPGSSCPPISCWNLAQVRLENGDRWRRPMCVDCAEAFERRCAENELAPPLFSAIEAPAP
jgi:hypothetical protein